MGRVPPLQRGLQLLPTGASFICLAASLVAAGCSEQKRMVTERVELPDSTGKPSASLGFSIYYEWNGRRDQYPWWFVCKQPDGDTWIVIEFCNQYADCEAVERAVGRARPLSAYWFDSGLLHLKRTGVEKVQHIVFGGDALPVERKAIAEVLRLTQAEDAKARLGGTQ